jgi:hypothetical protein
MFLYPRDGSGSVLAIPQVSHAWLACQLAEHWGNRRFSRPVPRAEVLAAIMLHDSGWSDFDLAPGINADGRPRTFDRMPPDGHLEIWRTSVERTAMHSRYAALLVARHFADMAAVKTADLLERGDTASARLAESFRAEMERRIASWEESLSSDARYQGCLAGPGRESNANLLTLADRISVFLCGALESDFEVMAPTASGGIESVRIAALDPSRWRVDPWPMEGDRVRLQCEGRLLPSLRFSSADELQATLRRAPVERLSFTLMRASAVS